MEDVVFDSFLAPELRAAVSETFWTPLAAVDRAAQWLDELGVSTVVDIGSGAGKFCVATAVRTRACLHGVEQRSRLVLAARELARTFGVDDRVTFSHGVFGETPLPPADVYYLYNPFGENVYGPEDRLDDQVDASDERYVRDVRAAEELFRSAPVGTYVLTYNGFGGRMPASYVMLRVDRQLPNTLRLWRKSRLPGWRPSG